MKSRKKTTGMFANLFSLLLIKAEQGEDIDAILEENFGGNIDCQLIANYFENVPTYPQLALDAGCGSGRSTLCLPNKGFHLVLLDIVPEAVKLAKFVYLKHDCYNTDFIVGDLTSLPLRSECFDLIWSGGVLEHFESILNPLREMGRVLRREGTLMLSLPNLFSIFGLKDKAYELVTYLFRKKVNSWSERAFTPNMVRRILQNQGFTVTDIAGIRSDLNINLPYVGSRCRKLLSRSRFAKTISHAFSKISKKWPALRLGYCFLFVICQKTFNMHNVVQKDC